MTTMVIVCDYNYDEDNDGLRTLLCPLWPPPVPVMVHYLHNTHCSVASLNHSEASLTYSEGLASKKFRRTASVGVKNSLWPREAVSA